MLDVVAGTMMEFVYTFITNEADVFKPFVQAIKAKENYPNLIKYVEKLRAHPHIAPYRIRKTGIAKYVTRAQSWPKGVKC